MAKVFKYNGKLYSDDYYLNNNKYTGSLDDLLYEISKENKSIYHEETLTIRYVGDEYYGTEENKSDEETLEDIIFYGYDDSLDLEEIV